jgi:hypothetical protein
LFSLRQRERIVGLILEPMRGTTKKPINNAA